MNALQLFLAEAKKLCPQALQKSGVVNYRLILLGIIGIILMIAGGVMDRHQPKSKPNLPAELSTVVPGNAMQSYEENMEKKLSAILSKIKGAGTVAVNITFENSTIQEHAKNITKESRKIEEKDNGGSGTRVTTETKDNEQVLVSKENGVDRPVVVDEIQPTIKGVLIVAEGAYDSNVKAALINAVKAGLGIPVYKITVLTSQK
jgi:stage III sporulation protein AG